MVAILRAAVIDNMHVCKEGDLKKYFFVILPVQKQTNKKDQDLFSFAI